VMSDNQIDMW